MTDFALGVRHAWLGVIHVAARRRLWPYVIGPSLLIGFLLLGAAVGAWVLGAVLVGWVWHPGPEAGWMVRALFVVVTLAVRLLLVLMATVVLYVTSSLLATPFVDRLSQEVEADVLGRVQEPFSWRRLAGDLASSVSHSVLSFGLWLGVVVVCGALNLVPVVGSLVSVVLATGATALLLAREAMDGPMSRRRLSYREKLGVVQRNAPAALGFGLVQTVVLGIPLLNVALLPMAVAGGTLLFCHLELGSGVAPPADPRSGPG